MTLFSCVLVFLHNIINTFNDKRVRHLPIFILYYIGNKIVIANIYKSVNCGNFMKRLVGLHEFYYFDHSK